jgi:hypothetical protein
MPFDVALARREILRYQPASHWVSASRDPTQRMTVGFGFGIARAEAPEMLRQIGLDPAAVRSGRMPLSDAQMNELFDLALLDAVDWAHQRVPGFADMPRERQYALLELIMWWGPGGSDFILAELEQLSLSLTHGPLEPSQWFDLTSEEASTELAGAAIGGGKRTMPVPTPRCRITFESFAFPAELRSDDPGLLDAAQAMLPPGWARSGAQPEAEFGLWANGLITVDGARADRVQDRELSLLRLGAIVRHHVAASTPEYTFVHAGVVAIDGCAIVIPGRSYTGKSTLVAELVRLGATYVSDEYAVLDQSGLVHPFAKPLSIRGGRYDPLGELVDVPPALVAHGPVRAGVIVLTSYAPGARWCPSARSSAEGALGLLQNTVSARMRPAAALSATSRLARGAAVLAGQRGEAADTARALLEVTFASGRALE